MNTVVRQIVDTLFEDITENEEVRALHEEVLNNCQERYDNLLRSGRSEEEAAKTVVESLIGMEELLAGYPKKQKGTGPLLPESTGAPAYPIDADTLPWEGIRALHIDVRSADVEIRRTEGRPQITLKNGNGSFLTACAEGKTLFVRQETGQAPDASEGPRPGGLLGILASAFDALREGDGGRVTIEVPSGFFESAFIRTASGDIRFAVPADDIELKTASGDCEADTSDGTGPSFRLGEDIPWKSSGGLCSRLRVTSTSGDVNLRGGYTDAELTTTSGDIDLIGTARELKMSSTSGDISAQTHAESVKARTTSGDIGIRVDGRHETGLELRSVSGDIELELEDAEAGIAADIRTRSGDVSCGDIERNENAPCRASIETISGDISISG